MQDVKVLVLAPLPSFPTLHVPRYNSGHLLKLRAQGDKR